MFVQTCNKLIFQNVSESTLPKAYETVDEIRENAPSHFMSGGRLVTLNDYRTFILNTFGSEIYDIFVCNNTIYLTVFYNWLKQYNKLNIDIRKDNYRFSDACDFNNIYLWLKPKNNSLLSDSISNLIKETCESKKTATTEIIPCNAIITNFIPYIKHPNISDNISDLIKNNSWMNKIRIVLTKRASCFINNEQIKEQVNKIIRDYFALENQKLGNIINISELEKLIMNTGIIESVKTKYISNDINISDYIYNGLSFGYFTMTIIDGLDFNVCQQTYKLQAFQFPKLFTESLLNVIEIDNENTINVTNIGF